jgi:hypothetical protein
MELHEPAWSRCSHPGFAEYSREAMAIWAAQGKPEHPFALIPKRHLALALRESGDLVQAERVSREVLAERRRQLGEKNRAVAHHWAPFSYRALAHATGSILLMTTPQQRRPIITMPAATRKAGRKLPVQSIMKPVNIGPTIPAMPPIAF